MTKRPGLDVLIALLLSLAAPVYAEGSQGGQPFLQSLALADGRRIVVAEPQLEPRSIGSFSIRIYSGANPRYPHDQFVTGTVVARDGFVERILLADLDGVPGEELVVVLRTAGSGDYGMALPFSLAGNRLQALASEALTPAGQRTVRQLEQ